jgi:hypothetical protein
VPSAIRRANGPLAYRRQVRVQHEQGIPHTNGERGPGVVVGHHLADLAYLDLGQDLHRYDHRTIVALDGQLRLGLWLRRLSSRWGPRRVARTARAAG